MLMRMWVMGLDIYFENDTLFAVYHGLWNVIREKEIDYSKYPNP